ncbi:MAG TPA: GNAT family N-acetyltransferase [Intrasporangiaceae bacterium]|nr:GNAT family N-acetyltransferase [Intrasporangiaceae bacterium]
MSHSDPADVTIIEVSGAATDPEGRARFEEWVEVFHRVQRADTGSSDAWSAEELRTVLDNPIKFFVDLAAVTADGQVVGAAELIFQREDNTHLVILNIGVLPAFRRRGIGRRLIEEVERVTREHGRRTIITETIWSGDEGAADVSGEFARRLGFEDVQTSRRSDLDVTTVAIDPDIPTGYAIETHVGTPPQADADDRAWLLRRMSTDAPLGGLDMEEQQWDAARIRSADERMERMGRGRVSAFARHLESGRLVAFTEIQVPAASPDLAYQQDTLVLREHRGHGLGLALKAANIAVLRDAYPGVERVRTWNALENSHMLAVNDALGCTTSGFEREWQKQL